MKITAKQSNVLDNLHRVVMRRMLSGRIAPHLDGKDCRMQIFSLAIKKLIVVDECGRPTRIGDPDGMIVSTWGGRKPRPNALNSLIGEAAT